MPLLCDVNVAAIAADGVSDVCVVVAVVVR